MDKKYDFLAIEKEILSLWRAHKADIDAAIQDANPDNKERYTFLEGPPTANAPPALHHVEARVFKDLFTRYKTLQGYKVSRKGGWDCHGLPVEVQVEKKLKLDSKKDVVKYGIDKFIAECKQDVFSFIKPWSDMTEKLAFWVDLDNPYVTLHTPYMESEWWALKQIYEKELLYKGHKVVPYCSRCGTPLSSHEVAQGYKDVDDTTVVATFVAQDQAFFVKKNLTVPNKPVTFLAWTTTPWTLPSNLALAVHPQVNYAFVESDTAIYVLAEDLVTKYFPENQKVIGSMLGKELQDKTYEPLFPYFADDAPNSFRVITADYVTTEDGTGIVHQAPAFGEDDNLVCKAHGIDFVNPVTEHGTFTEEVIDFAGQFVKDADPAIIEHLEKIGKLFTTEKYVHSYPFCWRCNTPLIYYAMDAWFIKVSEPHLKKRLLELNDMINWYPATIKTGRFGNWLEHARDWALSRNKFWGTPLPIWICENENCKHEEIIGSIAELHEKTGTLVDDLHLGTVNPLTYACEHCGKTMRRTPEVIDTWFDSGSAPFAQFHYPFENKDLFEESFPYDFISEGIDQTRGWFYTLHVINGILFDRPAYKNVAVAGLLSDDNGEKMSKSKGNIIVPAEIFAKEGVDGVRLAMASYPLGNAIRFGESVFKEQLKPFFTIFWNTYYYINDYITRTGLTGIETHDGRTLEDEWLISKTSSLIIEVEERLEKHEYNHAINVIIDFVSNTLSRTYIKLVRDRTAEKDESLAYVMRHALETATTLLSPFAPYLTEHIYQNFFAHKPSWSIHFSSWPKAGYQNKQLEKEFELAQQFIAGILAAREKAQRGVRWPVKEVKILTQEKVSLQESIFDLVLTQTNVKQIDFVTDFPVMYKFEIDFRKLGEVFGTETGDVIPLVKEHLDMITTTLNQSETVVVGKWTLERDYFKVEKIIPKPYIMAPFNSGEVYLDTTMTLELEAEGFAREITRRVQDLRKTAGLQKNDAIVLSIQTEDLADVVKIHHESIGTKVGAEKFDLNTGKVYEHICEEQVKGKTFTLSLQKI
ncbi:isoleucine--tRNA ligase [Candidatus Woesearchaeota archaeon]|nr:isoleucine--tRNA ligase [Candidatus Woesearchaeota archaeon]